MSERAHPGMFHAELHVEPERPGKGRRCSGCGAPCDRPGQKLCHACHAAYMRAFRARHKLQLLVPAVFRFREEGGGCSFWRSVGEHIVVEGRCRCGRQFVVEERLGGA